MIKPDRRPMKFADVIDILDTAASHGQALDPDAIFSRYLYKSQVQPFYGYSEDLETAANVVEYLHGIGLLKIVSDPREHNRFFRRYMMRDDLNPLQRRTLDEFTIYAMNSLDETRESLDRAYSMARFFGALKPEMPLAASDLEKNITSPEDYREMSLGYMLLGDEKKARDNLAIYVETRQAMSPGDFIPQDLEDARRILGDFRRTYQIFRDSLRTLNVVRQEKYMAQPMLYLTP